MSGKYHVRSISLPTRSHPTTLEVEEALNKLKAWESSPTSGSICNGLSGVEELCKYVDKLLNLASTQEVLSHNQKGKCHEELLDGSVRLLDVCSIARDILLRFREQVQALQSAFRRRKGDSSIETSVATFNCFRKKMKKDAKKLIASLKQMDNKHGASSLLDQDQHLSAVIRVIREVNVTNCSIFQSLLVFLSTSSKPKQSRWSLVSKLMYKGVVACEEKEEDDSELVAVYAALSEVSDSEKVKITYKKLEALLTSIEDLESCLESVFRILIKTRSSLLNLISL
ncbi:BPS1-LIKE PROTEIN [Salix viminalis]|uniref:BPS1-LIKE PROTEIN n=1 Tax=Salix viminalis TaxID=40686 RepID=A0A9Q0UUZ8_SALVM|nr:BPS1-LIKE PROTEIN [Salix viminalis]